MHAEITTRQPYTETRWLRLNNLIMSRDMGKYYGIRTTRITLFFNIRVHYYIALCLRILYNVYYRFCPVRVGLSILKLGLTCRRGNICVNGTRTMSLLRGRRSQIFEIVDSKT